MTNAVAVPNLAAFDISDASEFDREAPTTERWPEGSQPIPSVVELHRVEDLTVHVQVDSQVWHKKAVGGFETACGITIHYGQLLGLRQETYLGELCPNCFTKHELEVLAPRARERERHDTDRAIQALEDDRKQMFDGHRAKREPKPKK